MRSRRVAAGGLFLLVAGTGFVVGGVLTAQLSAIAVGGCLVLMGIGIWFIRNPE